MLMLTPEQQAAWWRTLLRCFRLFRVAGTDGDDRVRLDAVSADVLEATLRMAWKRQAPKGSAGTVP